MNHPFRMVAKIALPAICWLGSCTISQAQIVVSHDVNTLASDVAGSQENRFAVNVATFLTANATTKKLILFESNPGDGSRNYSSGVLTALASNGFSVTLTADYKTPFSGFDAVFVSEDFPIIGFLDGNSLIKYVNGGGGVYLAGGVGNTASVEASGWNTFLYFYGLGFTSTGYNGINSVAISSSHPIFAGITSLGSGNGQSILNLGTNPNAKIVQFAGNQGVYAVVNTVQQQAVPEPGSIALLAGVGVSGSIFAIRQFRRRRK